VPTATEQAAVEARRLAPGEAAGSRARGLSGWARHVRRKAAARLRGELDLDRLVDEGLQLGRDVLIARGCYIDPGFSWLVSIGDEATIGPNVTILTHDATPKLRTGYSLIAPVRIGARVFVGANVTILPGVAVGDDAIVGAGSVVRRDVPPGRVVIGNPAVEVGATDDHARHHAERLAVRPRFPDIRGAGRVPGRDERRRMLDELGGGAGYVR
jgi:maltose O-acetyltransferase